MNSSARTPRRLLLELLVGHLFSARELAERTGLSEREVEDHLLHVIKTLNHAPTKRFVMEPPTCFECGYLFRHRQRLTCPSRCPRCRRETIIPPRFGIRESPDGR